MAIETSRTIYVDFSIETGDLFRANLGFARVRLMVGLAFSIGLILGLVFLFVVIDEKTILLKTSPLFIGLPLVAAGGQILRLHAVCRKYVNGLAESQRRIQYTFYEHGDGYNVASGESFTHVSWKDVLKIVEQPRSLQIYLSKYDIQIIPKRGLNQARDINVLREMLRSSINARAQLLKSGG